MAFYYVKAGFGTATGDGGRYATQQTGTFAALGAAGVYNDIQDAIDNSTTSPAGDDFIICSDLHNFATTSPITYNGLSSGVMFLIMSASDSDIEAAPSGNAKETINSSSSDHTFNGRLSFKNIDVIGGDNIVISGDCNLIMKDSKLNLSGVNDMMQMNSDGIIVKLINSELAFDGANATIQMSNGAELQMLGGSVTTISAGITNLINGTALGAGASGRFFGVDMQGVTGTIINGMGGNAGDDRIDFILDGCALASGVVIFGESIQALNQKVIAQRCSSSSSASEYQFYTEEAQAEINDDSVIFRNEDEPFTESNQKISYKINTNSNCGLSNPLSFDFPVLRYSKLATGATDTLRFYITSNTALTDNDIYIEVNYPDGTTKNVFNFLSTRGFPLATGTTLTTDATSSWTGALSNLYQIDVDTSGDAGADCQPIVKVYVTLPSVTIQIASEFGLN